MKVFPMVGSTRQVPLRPAPERGVREDGKEEPEDAFAKRLQEHEASWAGIDVTARIVPGDIYIDWLARVGAEKSKPDAKTAPIVALYKQIVAESLLGISGALFIPPSGGEPQPCPSGAASLPFLGTGELIVYVANACLRAQNPTPQQRES